MIEKLLGVIGADVDTQGVAMSLVLVGADSQGTGGAQVRWVRRPREHESLQSWEDFVSEIVGYLEACRDTGVQHVYLEDVYNGPSAHALRGPNAEFALVARLAKLVVHRVTPVDWQQEVLGLSRGRAAIKLESRRVAEDLAGMKIMSEHECDATCIGIYGCRVLGENA